MARKSRYAGYYKATLGREKKTEQSTQKSILGRLKELKNQEFVMNVPIGDGNGK